MHYLWGQLSGALSLIVHHPGFLITLTWATLRVAVISTAAALVIGLPLAVALALGRFRGRRVLLALANAGLALPPVVVGVVVLLLLIPEGPFGSLQIEFTLRAVYAVQAMLALPYIVALSAAAIRGLPVGLLAQARALGAGRAALGALALREARIGILAAVIAAVAAVVSEVGAVVIVGGNIVGQTQLLSSALLADFTFSPNDPHEVAIALVLSVVILVLLGSLTAIQQRNDGLRLRFRETTVREAQ